LHHAKQTDEGVDSARYAVVTVELGKEGWAAMVTVDNVYDSLDPGIWKESVYFVAKHLGRQIYQMLFSRQKCHKKPTPSPYKGFSYKSMISDDGEYEDDCSCGPYC
jgi:hypothetical protein